MRFRPLAPLLILACLAAWPSAFAPAFANDGSAAIRAAIETVLDQRHPTDTPAWWIGLGTGAPPIIIGMYHEETHIYRRIRLLQALSWYDDPDATAFLKNQALNTDDDVIRNAAVSSVGISQGAREEDFITKFLQSEDPQTRYVAATALKRIGDPRAQQTLLKYLGTEKAQWVREKVEHEPITQPDPKLKIVKREERKLNAAFGGHFTGFWLEPRSPDEPGMRCDAVTMDLDLENGTELTGELVVRRGDKALHYTLDRLIGQDSRVTGFLVRVLPKADGKAEKKEELAFDAELAQKGRITLLHIVIPQSLATIGVRRTSK